MKREDDPWDTWTFHKEPNVGKIAGSPVYGKWNSWIPQQGEIWIDMFNRVYLIKDISDRYAFNILRFVYLQHREDLGDDPLLNPLVQAIARKLKLNSFLMWDAVEANASWPWKDHFRALPAGKR